jgi:DNA-binding transcriptional LysR family regulator
LPGILRQYRNEYPEVELSLRELSTATQLAQLNTGLLDVGVARGPVVDSALTAGVIHRDHFLAVLPEGHRLSARDEIPLRDLSGERFVMFPVRAAPAFHQSILQAFGSAGFTPSIAEEASEWHTIVGLVSVGLGVAIAPAFVSRMGWSNVALRPLSHCSLRAELVVAHSQANTSPLVAGFRRVAERMAGG